MSGGVVTSDVLRDTPAGPRLVGSACPRCSAVTFPPQVSCPRCTSGAARECLLPATGTLWGYTVQAFPPKSPYLAADGVPAPFGVGYVDLGEVLVESRLVATSAAALRPGMAMRLVVVPFHVPDAGQPQLTYAFEPVGSP